MSMNAGSSDFEKLCKELKSNLSLEQVKWLELGEPEHLAHYDEWLGRHWHGEMDYLQRHRDQKSNPESLLPNAKSVVMIAQNYVPVDRPHQAFQNLRIANYAQSFDYHDWFHEKLRQAVDFLKIRFPEQEFYFATDAAPFFERDYAVQAGLGWWGKNTCVIHPDLGSFFFIGEILTTVDISSDISSVPDARTSRFHDFCGTCTRCIDICPTQALQAPRKLDATKCISYWTIESKTIPTPTFREKMGDWFFGCDLCQSVCPWNKKAFKDQLFKNSIDSTLFTTEGEIDELRWLIEAEDQEIRKKTKGTPLARAKPLGLRRNALIVIGNKKICQLANSVETLKNHPVLSDLATWCLGKLNASQTLG